MADSWLKLSAFYCIILQNKVDRSEKNEWKKKCSYGSSCKENAKANTTKIESENKLFSNIKVIIDGKDYNAILEENESAQNFANILPQEFNMNELNGNEKYIYLNNTLPTKSYNPKHIEAGDIMLYGNNCLVVFYKSFDTSYSYTKIGHIENLSNLGNDNITIKFMK